MAGRIHMIRIEESFRDRFNHAMRMSDMSAAELSRKTGISESTLSQYRSGYAKPKNERLVKLANALGVDPSWLMGLDVPMHPGDVHPNVHSDGYYKDPEAARIAQRIYEDPNLRILFNAADDVSPENLLLAAEMLKRMKETNPDG